jgi:hypothetical protein
VHLLFPYFVPDLVPGLVVGFPPCEANNRASGKPESAKVPACRQGPVATLWLNLGTPEKRGSAALLDQFAGAFVDFVNGYPLSR